MKDRTESGLPLQNQRIHSDPTILENEIGNGLIIQCKKISITGVERQTLILLTYVLFAQLPGVNCQFSFPLTTFLEQNCQLSTSLMTYLVLNCQFSTSLTTYLRENCQIFLPLGGLPGVELPVLHLLDPHKEEVTEACPTANTFSIPFILERRQDFIIQQTSRNICPKMLGRAIDLIIMNIVGRRFLFLAYLAHKEYDKIVGHNVYLISIPIHIFS